MKIFVKGRQKGKTTELVKISAATNTTIVVVSPFMRERTLRLAKELGLTIPKPITFEELLSGRALGMNIGDVWIDDAEMLLAQIVKDNTNGKTLKGIAMSIKEEVL